MSRTRFRLPLISDLAMQIHSYADGFEFHRESWVPHARLKCMHPSLSVNTDTVRAQEMLHFGMYIVLGSYTTFNIKAT